ncbi:MAG: CoB--CoM heterodisulfide reductase iron-sulfur subunit A family protein, partial [Deltaproteobacteria bacterium]|nr:CoB--CoM heterodisulfide reductase iron-sulfur subunit A family protein [Deltaproteobacteria bacterium]
NLRPAKEVLDEKLARLKKSGARVLLNSSVDHITGFVGSFVATISGQVDETIDVGAVILAFGADLYEPGSQHRYDKLKNVITAEELEQAFCAGDDLSFGSKSQPKSAAIVLCVGSRCDDFTGCSRYCCATGIKQALELNRKGIDTTVFYRDIRTVSTGSEEMYRQARGEGVLFIRVPEGEEVEIMGAKRASAVRSNDQLLGRKIEAPADLVILGTGMRARQPETTFYHEMLKPSVGLDGFFMERHAELAPVETAVEGILLAGTVQGPKDIVDTVAQASATASKAAVFLSHDEVKLDPAVCEVADTDDCRGCGVCVDICQYQAPQLVESPPGFWTVNINPSLCKGCGTCASWCPSGAIVARHFTDRQVVSMIDAFFGEEGTEAAP